MTTVPLAPPARLIDAEIDGEAVRVPEGETILDACRSRSIDTPTMCYADNLTPVNACRVGTVRQEEALHRLVSGRTIGSAADEVALLGEIAQVMRDASICGLGQTAASAVQSALGRFGLLQGTGA